MRDLKIFLAATAAAVGVAGALVAPAHAQETTSTIRGTVIAEGAPVAGAQVKVTHVTTGTMSSALTDSSGGFTAAGLRVGGPYTVEVIASGYTTSTVTDSGATATRINDIIENSGLKNYRGQVAPRNAF